MNSTHLRNAPGASAFTLAQVLPHEGRMLLLDELLDYGPQYAACSVIIRPDSMFCDGPLGVPAWVGLEYMAQTACAYSGLEEAQRGSRPSIALLLGTRRYRASTQAFAIGARLRVVAELVLRDDNDLAAFKCAIYERDEMVAQGDIKAIRPRELSALIARGGLQPERSS